MLTLNDGRSELWQWDTGRMLSVSADCSQVHFSNKVFGRSIDVDVVDGLASIPDVLLQTDKELTAWAFVGTAENGYTKISNVFKVNKRNKPSDYVFTPTDQTTLDDILDRIEDLEKRPSGGNGGIVEEVDPTVPDWAKQPQKPAYTATEVGALPNTTKIPSTAEDIGALPSNTFIPKYAADVGAIPAPATAQVGQTIVVKEVDEDGKPVSWECADVAGQCTFHATATFDGTVSSIIISEDDSGNPMSLDECWIVTKYVGKTNYLSTWINDRQASYRHALDASSNTMLEIQHYIRFGDSVYGIVGRSTDYGVSGMNHAITASGISRNFLNAKKIEKIRAGSAFGSDLLTEGTTIEIFGR